MREMRCKEKELRVVARRERGCWLPCGQRDKMSQVEIFYIYQERESGMHALFYDLCFLPLCDICLCRLGR
jgi:hypothetical protein